MCEREGTRYVLQKGGEMKKTLSMLAVSALLLMAGLSIAPAYVYADTSKPSGPLGVASVPEPASLILLGAGLAGIAIWRRKSH